MTYHGMNLETFLAMGVLWSSERQGGDGFTVTRSTRILGCSRRAAAKTIHRIVAAGMLYHDETVHLPRYEKLYRSTERWHKIVKADPDSIPGDCVRCGAPSLPYPFRGRFYCRACLQSVNAEIEAERLIRSLPLTEATRIVLDSRPGYRHTAAGLREVLDEHPELAKYGIMGREQLCTRALSFLASTIGKYGAAVDNLGRRYYWRVP